MSNKKAQITLFVIIGLILLIIVALIFALPKFKSTSITEATKTVSLQPLDAHVKNCLSILGKEGIIKLGAHGGYINPDEFGITANYLMPTASSGVSMFDISDVIPYWFYLKSSNTCKENCLLSSEEPPLASVSGKKSMESQLASYIEKNILSCINNMSDFEKTGITAQIIGEPKAEVFIRDNSVAFFLTQKIKASYKGKDYEMEKYHADISVNLKKAYEIMDTLIGYAKNPNTRFFESKTMHIIGSYGMGDNPVLPPIGGGTEIGKADVGPWQLTSVNNKIREILEDHVSLFTVDQTRNSYIIITQDPIFNGIYNEFVLNIPSLLNPEDYSINFVYLQDWPIYVNVNPSKGGMIRAETKTFDLIPFLKLSVKDFAYDISYPIIVIVRDEKAFDGEGFVFQAAMEVNIRGNQPINISSASSELQAASSLFCDYNQRLSGIISLNAKDEKGNPLTDANVLYECGDETCFITDTGNQGSISEKFPLCTNGVVRVEKEGYFASPKRLTTTANTPVDIEITSQPLVDLKAEIKKAPLRKVIVGGETNWVFDGGSITSLDPDDKAIIIMNRKPGIGEPELAQSVQINGKLNEEKTIQLTEGSYSLNIMLVTNLGNDSLSKKIINIPLINPPVNPDDWMILDSLYSSGQVMLDESAGGLVGISTPELESGKITFVVPYVNSDDLTVADDLISYTDAMNSLSTTNANDFKPRFG